jgi:hypothetical protein
VQWRCLCRNNKPEEALKNYVKAAEINKNDFTTPPFLVKSWKTAFLGKKEDALNISQTLKTIMMRLQRLLQLMF